MKTMLTVCVAFLIILLMSSYTINRSNTKRLEATVNQLKVSVEQLEISQNISLAFYSQDKLLERVRVQRPDVFVAMTDAAMVKDKIGNDFGETVNTITKEVQRIIPDAKVHVYLFNKDCNPMFFSGGTWTNVTDEHMKESFK